MSQTLIWLLFFIVAALVLLFSALTKKKFSVKEIALIGMMAALSFIAYLLRIPNAFGTGSSFHLGNTFTALTAMLMDGVSGGLAGAIGLSLADLFNGDPGYAITTFILKFLIGLCCGFVSHRVFRLKQLSVKEGGKYVAIVVACAASGLLLNILTDPLLGYFRNIYIFGQDVSIATVWTKIAGGVTAVNSLMSTVCAVLLYLPLRPALEKTGLISRE